MWPLDQAATQAPAPASLTAAGQGRAVIESLSPGVGWCPLSALLVNRTMALSFLSLPLKKPTRDEFLFNTTKFMINTVLKYKVQTSISMSISVIQTGTAQLKQKIPTDVQ